MNAKKAHTFVWQLSALLADESDYESKLEPKFQQLQDYLKLCDLNREVLEKQHDELWKTGLMLESHIMRLRYMLDSEKAGV